jgi:hypothetical protein
MPKTTVNLERNSSFPLDLPPIMPSDPPPMDELMPGVFVSWLITTAISNTETMTVKTIKKSSIIPP